MHNPYSSTAIKVPSALMVTILLFLTTLANSFAERVPSFGPNGTHWPEMIDTPFFLDQSVPNRIEVDASWDAISSALSQVTPEQAAEGTVILVRPGTITGNGAGGGSRPVLEDAGNLSWQRRVTIAPLEGYGSVTLAEGTRLLRVYRVCLAGFIVDTIKFEGCKQSAAAWMKIGGWLAIYGSTGVVTDMFEAVELVQPTHYLLDADTSDCYTSGGDIINWRFDGCYHAPRYYNVPIVGGKPHTDTMQFAPVGGGTTRDMHFRDCALYSSNNCAIQTGRLIGMTLENTLLAAGPIALSRYPHLPGGATDGIINCLNGAGGNFTAIDSILIGGIAINQADSERPWTRVENTITNRDQGGGNAPLQGSWTVNTELSESDIDIPPFPTDEYLNSIWQGSGFDLRSAPPIADPPGGSFVSDVQVTLEAPSTSGSSNIEIYYSLNGGASTPYTGPITITSSATLSATAVESGKEPSSPVTYSFQFSNTSQAPTFHPDSGLLFPGQRVTLSCETDPCTIYYSFDSSAAKEDFTQYTEPFELDFEIGDTLRAYASSPNLQDSAIVSRTYSYEDSLNSSGQWQNFPLESSDEIFTARWTATINKDQGDSLVGFSKGEADWFSDMACIVRFNPDGNIDVRNGTVYDYTNLFPYQKDVVYQFVLIADIPNSQYSVFVKTADSNAYQLLAENFSFRDTQTGISDIDNLVIIAVDGSHSMTEFSSNFPHIPPPPQEVKQTAE